MLFCSNNIALTCNVAPKNRVEKMRAFILKAESRISVHRLGDAAGSLRFFVSTQNDVTTLSIRHNMPSAISHALLFHRMLHICDC